MSREGPDDPGQQSRAGTLSGPGALTDAPVTGSEYQPDEASGSSGESLAALAKQYGLKPSAARPPLLDYIQQIWQRRYFVTGFATAQNVAMYTEARLGQIWQVLTPLLNVAVYFLIFGIVLDTSRGVHHFIAFLVIGVFIFNFTQRSFIISSRVMFDSLPLIRALHFPRACLPLGYVLIELQQLAISLIVIFATVLAVGEPFTWYWLLIIPILILQTVFNVGAAFILARFGAGFDDVSQLLPFIVRTWFYASGVMFNIQTYKNLTQHHAFIAKLLAYNPASIYITLVRDALMKSQRESSPGAAPFNSTLCNLYYRNLSKNWPDSAHCHASVSQAHLWLFGAGWAVVILLVGFVFFWRAEVRYGRG
jgi:teichoic acid transport system permease protein